MSFEFAIGCLETLLTVVLFGTTYVPVKKHGALDGMFCTFLLGISTFMVGCILFAFQGFEPKVYPLAMLGGAIWTIGNTAVIPIVDRVGLAIGYLIWNTINCIVGWSTTYFGLFGVTAKPAAIEWMNFLGVGIVLIGGIISSFVEKYDDSKELTNSNSTTKNENIESLPTPMMISYPIEEISHKLKVEEQERSSFGTQRIIGIVLAACAGVFFGFMNFPIFLMQDNPEKFDNSPTDLLPYIFSQFLGIFITATIIFVAYCFVKKNKPLITPELVLPGLLSGVIFSTGQVSFFAAVEILTASITFPIVAMMHGLVAAVWSIFYFKEIQGKRNYILIGTAFAVNLIGSTLIALSK